MTESPTTEQQAPPVPSVTVLPGKVSHLGVDQEDAASIVSDEQLVAENAPSAQATPPLGSDQLSSRPDDRSSDAQATADQPPSTEAADAPPALPHAPAMITITPDARTDQVLESTDSGTLTTELEEEPPLGTDTSREADAPGADGPEGLAQATGGLAEGRATSEASASEGCSTAPSPSTEPHAPAPEAGMPGADPVDPGETSILRIPFQATLRRLLRTWAEQGGSGRGECAACQPSRTSSRDSLSEVVLDFDTSPGGDDAPATDAPAGARGTASPRVSNASLPVVEMDQDGDVVRSHALQCPQGWLLLLPEAPSNGPGSEADDEPLSPAPTAEELAQSQLLGFLSEAVSLDPDLEENQHAAELCGLTVRAATEVAAAGAPVSSKRDVLLLTYLLLRLDGDTAAAGRIFRHLRRSQRKLDAGLIRGRSAGQRAVHIPPFVERRLCPDAADSATRTRVANALDDWYICMQWFIAGTWACFGLAANWTGVLVHAALTEQLPGLLDALARQAATNAVVAAPAEGDLDTLEEPDSFDVAIRLRAARALARIGDPLLANVNLAVWTGEIYDEWPVERRTLCEQQDRAPGQDDAPPGDDLFFVEHRDTGETLSAMFGAVSTTAAASLLLAGLTSPAPGAGDARHPAGPLVQLEDHQRGLSSVSISLRALLGDPDALLALVDFANSQADNDVREARDTATGRRARLRQRLRRLAGHKTATGGKPDPPTTSAHGHAHSDDMRHQAGSPDDADRQSADGPRLEELVEGADERDMEEAEAEAHALAAGAGRSTRTQRALNAAYLFWRCLEFERAALMLGEGTVEQGRDVLEAMAREIIDAYLVPGGPEYVGPLPETCLQHVSERLFQGTDIRRDLFRPVREYLLPASAAEAAEARPGGRAAAGWQDDASDPGPGPDLRKLLRAFLADGSRANSVLQTDQARRREIALATASLAAKRKAARRRARAQDALLAAGRALAGQAPSLRRGLQMPAERTAAQVLAAVRRTGRALPRMGRRARRARAMDFLPAPASTGHAGDSAGAPPLTEDHPADDPLIWQCDALIFDRGKWMPSDTPPPSVDEAMDVCARTTVASFRLGPGGDPDAPGAALTLDPETLVTGLPEVILLQRVSDPARAAILSCITIQRMYCVTPPAPRDSMAFAAGLMILSRIRPSLVVVLPDAPVMMMLCGLNARRTTLATFDAHPGVLQGLASVQRQPGWRATDCIYAGPVAGASMVEQASAMGFFDAWSRHCTGQSSERSRTAVAPDCCRGLGHPAARTVVAHRVMALFDGETADPDDYPLPEVAPGSPALGVPSPPEGSPAPRGPAADLKIATPVLQDPGSEGAASPAVSPSSPAVSPSSPAVSPSSPDGSAASPLAAPATRSPPGEVATHISAELLQEDLRTRPDRMLIQTGTPIGSPERPLRQLPGVSGQGPPRPGPAAQRALRLAARRRGLKVTLEAPPSAVAAARAAHAARSSPNHQLALSGEASFGCQVM
ncbi:hypothetical protein H696_02214 [Fonticula alba]|uniref:Uncharacterized protein n=1 Tax=Fonticula alba TaxID=691883 RepID=A0A058ZCV3_FONAL|nr:hypothetical protein H696_02214 [Fonticula alba]KCV71267.1 hypothetical protein H696_02214 [Fonticula alba]|eukprot:XP_009494390.1 hypothetical protein H696_02214 [Fonticula alba]